MGLDGDAIEQRIFESASFLALENRCAEAMPRLEGVHPPIPCRPHFSEAQFYLGNCLFDQDSTESAYDAYVAVLAMPAGEFTEGLCLGCRHHRVERRQPSRRLLDTTKRSRKLPCSKPTNWKRPLAKCAVTICWAKKSKPLTSRHA